MINYTPLAPMRTYGKVKVTPNAFLASVLDDRLHLPATLPIVDKYLSTLRVGGWVGPRDIGSSDCEGKCLYACLESNQDSLALSLLNIGRAAAQAVSRWLPTAAALVLVRVACGACGQSGTAAGFLRVLRFPLPIIIPPISPSS
jgi:hypothetical protein